MIKIIFFIFALNVLGKEIIQKYACADELEADVCKLDSKQTLEGKTIITTFVKKCSDKKYCHENGMCLKRDLYKLDNGEDCLVSEECKSQYCSDKKKCSIIPEEGECSEQIVEDSVSNQCGYLAYCDTVNDRKVCIKYAQQGESCEEKNCGIGLVCGLGDLCVKMFSLDDGAETAHQYACKSGNAEAGTDGKIYCIRYSLTKNNCATNNTCTFTYSIEGEEKTTEENCIEDVNGEKTQCLPMEGSELWDKYVKEFTEKINEMKEEDFEGITNTATLNKKSIAEAYVDFVYEPIVKDNECLRDYYVSQIGYISSSFSSYHKVSILVLLLAFII